MWCESGDGRVVQWLAPYGQSALRASTLVCNAGKTSQILSMEKHIVQPKIYGLISIDTACLRKAMEIDAYQPHRRHFQVGNSASFLLAL